MDHNPNDFLLAVGATAHMKDGTQRNNVVWKHCNDHVLRFYTQEGQQLTGVESLSGGSVVVSLQELAHYKINCQEER